MYHKLESAVNYRMQTRGSKFIEVLPMAFALTMLGGILSGCVGFLAFLVIKFVQFWPGV